MYIEHPYFYEGKYYAKSFDFSNKRKLKDFLK